MTGRTRLLLTWRHSLGKGLPQARETNVPHDEDTGTLASRREFKLEPQDTLLPREPSGSREQTRVSHRRLSSQGLWPEEFLAGRGPHTRGLYTPAWACGFGISCGDGREPRACRSTTNPVMRRSVSPLGDGRTDTHAHTCRRLLPGPPGPRGWARHGALQTAPCGGASRPLAGNHRRGERTSFGETRPVTLGRPPFRSLAQGNESEHCSVVEVDDSAQTRRTLTADLIRHLLSPSSKPFQSSATFRGKSPGTIRQSICFKLPQDV